MAIKKLGDFTPFEYSENQTEAVQNKKINSHQAREINKERDSIAYTLRDAAEFTDDEKQKRFENLAEGIDDTDLSEIRAFKQKINAERQEIRGMIELYTNTINKNRNVFGMDSNRGLNAADEYLKEFMELPLEEKRQWLSKIESDIKERIELYRRAKELMPDREEMIGTMRRSELQELLKKSEAFLTEAESIFKNNKDLFTDKEKQDYIEQLSDSTRSDQAQTINQISLELSERRELAATYGKIPPKYKQFAAGFEKMAFEERKIAIEKVEVAITKDYRDQQRNHPLAKHVSEASKDDAYKYFQGASLEKKFEALSMLESQFQFEKNLSDEYESLLDRLETRGNKVTIERLRIDFYKATFNDKEKKLIPELKAKVEKTEATTEEEKQLDKEYEAKLDDALNKKYISRKTKERSMKLWNGDSIQYGGKSFQHNIDPIQYKRDANTPSKFNKLMAPRIALFERFTALPDEIQDANKTFFETGHLRRLQIVNKLEKELSINDKKIPEDTENKKQITSAESIKEQRIQDLTNSATKAERERKFELALEYYEQIIKLDPNDEIAASRMEQIITKIEKEAKTSRQTDKTEKKPDNQSEKEKGLINKAMNSQELMEERNHYTIVSAAAKETMLSENQHNKIEASKRQDDAEDKEMAESLEEFSDGAFVLNSQGEAEEIVEIDIDKAMNSDEKAALKRTIVNGVIKSSNKTAAKNIQFRNQKGQDLSARAGNEKAEQMEEKMKDTVANKVIEIARKRRMNVDEDEIKDKVDGKDFERMDIAA